MSKLEQDAEVWQTTLKRSTLSLGLWSGSWLLSTALLAFGPRFLWQFDTLYSLLALMLNLGLGAVMIRANIRQVQAMDELARKIFLDAAAITLGVGLVCACSYGIMEDIRLISFEPDISHLMLLMGLTFLVGVLAGNRRYR
ncbi:hypothetical protein LZP73_09090 [Shewanella sp. AS16]|uniref:hypothetical protein n=1 Tax=Shewanella sp. AS16 TaxID=2907625 RepID=UPI001F3E983C|nr:hypothetical protein [Shewanella sp. AS16]MCE9686366.1 hypothetical protein [Shewanella sp. AS16]